MTAVRSLCQDDAAPSNDVARWVSARTMARSKVKRLPVVDAGGPVRRHRQRSDLLKVFLRTDEDIAEEIRREVVSYLFPTPGSSVRVEVRDGS